MSGTSKLSPGVPKLAIKLTLSITIITSMDELAIK